jgi:hypothetical protein
MFDRQIGKINSCKLTTGRHWQLSDDRDDAIRLAKAKAASFAT